MISASFATAHPNLVGRFQRVIGNLYIRFPPMENPGQIDLSTFTREAMPRLSPEKQMRVLRYRAVLDRVLQAGLVKALQGFHGDVGEVATLDMLQFLENLAEPKQP